MAWMLKTGIHVNRRTILLLMCLGTSLIYFISSVKTVKPSRPRCYADGPSEEGKDVVLKCVSSDGTQPLKYSWEKTSDNKLLPASSVMGKCAPTQPLQSMRWTVLKVSCYDTVWQEIMSLWACILNLCKKIPFEMSRKPPLSALQDILVSVAFNTNDLLLSASSPEGHTSQHHSNHKRRCRPLLAHSVATAAP